MKGIPSDYKVTVAEVERYLNKWQGLTNYVDQEEALDMLFNNLCPHSTCIKDVLLKISVLNDFYSTNIYDVHSVAVHYLNDVKDVDRRIQQADATLEDQLATVPMGKDGKKIRHYSFVFFM